MVKCLRRVKQLECFVSNFCNLSTQQLSASVNSDHYIDVTSENVNNAKVTAIYMLNGKSRDSYYS